jgi:hypothetical protein
LIFSLYNTGWHRSIRYCLILPYFPVNNARVIYTNMFSERKKTTVHVIHKVRVMQLK